MEFSPSSTGDGGYDWDHRQIATRAGGDDTRGQGGVIAPRREDQSAQFVFAGAAGEEVGMIDEPVVDQLIGCGQVAVLHKPL